MSFTTKTSLKSKKLTKKQNNNHAVEENKHKPSTRPSKTSPGISNKKLSLE